MKKIVTIILCSALVVISGCDNYDFAQEQFRKEVNLLSNSSLPSCSREEIPFSWWLH